MLHHRTYVWVLLEHILRDLSHPVTCEGWAEVRRRTKFHNSVIIFIAAAAATQNLERACGAITAPSCATGNYEGGEGGKLRQV